MGREIELKYKVGDLEAVRKALRRAGAKYRFTAFQNDCYFDTPRRSLLRADCGVRLREARCLKAGSERPDARPLLTFKGPRRAGGRAKSRNEHQTCVDDAEAIGEILTACGLEPVLRIEKRRAGYRLDRCLVELDELPLLGCFVEVEGPSVRAIDTVAAKLGLPGEPSRDHYVNLLCKACRNVGGPCREVTFQKCSPRCRRRRGS